MSVNLDKKSKQENKVSLRKETLNKETKISLQKEASSKGRKVSLQKETTQVMDRTVDSGLDSVSESVDGGKQSLLSNSANEKKEKRLLRWMWIPFAAVLLIAGAALKSRDSGVDDTFLTAGINESSADNDMEEDLNEVTQNEGNDDEEGLTENSWVQGETEADEEMDNEESSVDGVETGQRIDDASIHNYEMIVEDVTWSEAFEDCISRGGYLCRINSVEENEKIKELLRDQDLKLVFLGGMRDEDSNEYHWIDDNENPYDDVINDGEYKQFWYDGEPSYIDHVDDKEIIEKYMAFIFIKRTKQWYWNDVSDDAVSLLPNYYSGKIAYICEYE